MGKFEEIIEKIKALQPSFNIEEIELQDASGRILQEDIFADMDMPPFNKSAMDGFACKLEDIEDELEVVETIQAGRVPMKTLGKYQCAKIMTGAPLPAGCDLVFKMEDSKITRESFVRCTNLKTSRNICYKGEDYKSGELLIQKGTLINTPRIAVLAGAGKQRVKVSVNPKVAVISTGSELVEPAETPQTGKIRNSNASQLISQLRKMKIDAKYFGLADDNLETLTSLFKKALEESDFVFFTGGASVGDFDLIPGLLEQHGFTIFWHTTGIKPGNPMTFSQKDDKYCFGLSGNPVSSLVQFELIAKHAMYKLLGANFKPLRMKVALAADYQQKIASRLIIVPVLINDDGLIEEIQFHGSAHINALTNANALMEIEPGVTKLNRGELVYVRQL